MHANDYSELIKELLQEQQHIDDLYCRGFLRDPKEYFRETILCLVDEAHELLHETDWKSWKDSTFSIRKEKYLDELMDVLRFWLDLALISRSSPSELSDAWSKNKDKVKSRVENG